MHDGHRKRMRDRFLKEGLDSFEPHQILELILFYSVPRKDTNKLAHVLLQKYGSLSAVLEADTDDLASIPGMGTNSAVLLSLIPSISRAYLKDRWGSKINISSSTGAGEYAVSLFTGKTNEAFYVICLDSQNNVNYPALLHEGTINEAMVYPRVVVETALRYKSSSVILAHNHPGGSTAPSAADIDVTKKLAAVLDAISIKVVDHIVVAGSKYVSFAEQGLL